MKIGRYDYEELKEKALSEDATQKDLENLYDWFEMYDVYSWDGYCYPIDGVNSLYPIYAETDEDEYEIVGYEIK